MPSVRPGMIAGRRQRRRGNPEYMHEIHLNHLLGQLRQQEEIAQRTLALRNEVTDQQTERLATHSREDLHQSFSMMNQICKVCGEPAAGFHFGAFTCEGCKSFFGRSYNNVTSVAECKNNGECIINKKNRTSCKACRLKKCIMVGMSKSGSRYGRRSNWFKIHCLLQEQHNAQQQQQQQQAAVNSMQNGMKMAQRTTPPPPGQQIPLGLLGVQPFSSPLLHLPRSREELMLLGLDEHLNSASPSVSSPESHNSDSSVELSDARRMPLFPGFLPPQFMPPPNFLLPPGYPAVYPGLLQPVNNNNNRLMVNMNQNHSPAAEAYKRVYLEAVLQSQRSPRTPTPEEIVQPPPKLAESPVQDTPIDLSMRSMSERGSSPTDSEPSTSRSMMTERGAGSEADEETSECDSERGKRTIKTTPLDLTRKS